MAAWDILANDPIGSPMPDAGGKCYIYAVRLRDVASTPSPVMGGVTAIPIQVSPGAPIATYYFDPQSVRLQERPQKGAQSPYHELSLVGFRSGIDPASRHEITKLEPGYYILVWQDAERGIRQLGTIERPMRFSASVDSGASDADSVGIDWEFSGIQYGHPLFMDPDSQVPNIIDNPCAAVSPSMFSATWNVSLDGELLNIAIAADDPYIDSIQSVPAAAVLIKPNGDAVPVAYNSVNGVGYTPVDTLFLTQVGDYILSLLSTPVPILLVTDDLCYVNLSFSYTNNSTGEPPTVTLYGYLPGSPSGNSVSLTGDAPLDITFNAQAQDSDGTIIEYRWDFNGDGTVDLVTTGPTADYTYTDAGTYNPIVTVVDDADNTDSDDMEIIVTTTSPGGIDYMEIESDFIVS